MSSSEAFADPHRSGPGWFGVCPSRHLKRERVKLLDLGDRRLAVYRDSDGVVRAMGARCSHMGADLSMGEVMGSCLRCPFHHFLYGPDGRCREAPGLATPPSRRQPVFPAEERWGWVWVFNRPEPRFPLPSLELGGPFRVFRGPDTRLRCHPHLATGNGFDTPHFETLHGMQYTRPPQLSPVLEDRLSVDLEARPRARWLRFLTGTVRDRIAARFTAYGGHMATFEVSRPVRFTALFNAQLLPGGGCLSRLWIMVTPPYLLNLWKAALLLRVALADDHKILDRLEFVPGYVESDEAFRQYVAMVVRCG